jgi:hypothetical protein
MTIGTEQLAAILDASCDCAAAGTAVAQRLAPASGCGPSHGSQFKVDVRKYGYKGQVQQLAPRLYLGRPRTFAREVADSRLYASWADTLMKLPPADPARRRAHDRFLKLQ